MSKAYLAAKEKYQAVLDDAGRGDYYCRTNRVGVTRHPSSGDCHPINRIDHPERRRSSAGSSATNGSSSGSSSSGGYPPMTFRERLRSWMNRPAY